MKKTQKKSKKKIAQNKVSRQKNTSTKAKLSVKKRQPKKISIKKTLGKIVDVLKPIASKKKKGNECIQNDQEAQQIADVPFAEKSSQPSCSQFFYTDDHNIESFDDQQLMQLLVMHYPDMSASQQSLQAKKHAIICILNDIDFMQKILDDYNMNIMDFFKFLFRLCPSVFKGLFIHKIQKAIKDKPYAQSLRFGKYSFTKLGPSKKCSIF